MFTGIVDHQGFIKAIERNDSSLRLLISCQFTDLKLGESIAINGVCLTVTDINNNAFSCDISPETYRLTNLKALLVNSPVNLERSMQLSDRLGGHFVMGHVDQVCRLREKQQHGEFYSYSFTGISPEDLCYLTKKGSISVNGVSLTINQVLADGFEVMLIPHTLEITNLSLLAPGDEVNIEFDYIARIVVNMHPVEEE